MKKRKSLKFIALTLCALMLLAVFASCDNATPETSKPELTDTPTEGATVSPTEWASLSDKTEPISEDDATEPTTDNTTIEEATTVAVSAEETATNGEISETAETYKLTVIGEGILLTTLNKRYAPGEKVTFRTELVYDVSILCYLNGIELTNGTPVKETVTYTAIEFSFIMPEEDAVLEIVMQSVVIPPAPTEEATTEPVTEEITTPPAIRLTLGAQEVFEGEVYSFTAEKYHEYWISWRSESISVTIIDEDGVEKTVGSDYSKYLSIGETITLTINAKDQAAESTVLYLCDYKTGLPLWEGVREVYATMYGAKYIFTAERDGIPESNRTPQPLGVYF